MQFTRRLHDGIRSGEITCTIRIWKQPRVKNGGYYNLHGGEVIIDSIQEISFAEITLDMARQSGFDDVADLLKTAKHGRGENVYLINFHYRDAYV